jgi:hypothetical protein
VALDLRLVTLNNIAMAIGSNISPFDPAVKKHTRMQAEVMMHLRFPQEQKEVQNKELDEDAARLELLDQAMYGTPPSQPINPATGRPYEAQSEYEEYEEEEW